MWPVLFSLANIDAGVRMKATSHVFALAAYLPIPKFINVSPEVQSLLSARIYHICLNYITDSLKGPPCKLSDPRGFTRLCLFILASWIADLPEQRLLACVIANQSPRSQANLQHFGDGISHELRT